MVKQNLDVNIEPFTASQQNYHLLLFDWELSTFLNVTQSLVTS